MLVPSYDDHFSKKIRKFIKKINEWVNRNVRREASKLNDLTTAYVYSSHFLLNIVPLTAANLPRLSQELRVLGYGNFFDVKSILVPMPYWLPALLMTTQAASKAWERGCVKSLTCEACLSVLLVSASCSYLHGRGAILLQTFRFYICKLVWVLSVGGFYCCLYLKHRYCHYS